MRSHHLRLIPCERHPLSSCADVAFLHMPSREFVIAGLDFVTHVATPFRFRYHACGKVTWRCRIAGSSAP